MVAHPVRHWLGIGGVLPDDNPRARLWERRLHGVMIAIALGSMLALYLTEGTQAPVLRAIGRGLEWGVFLAASCMQICVGCTRMWCACERS